MDEYSRFRRTIDLIGVVIVCGVGLGGALLVPDWFDASRVELDAETARLEKLLVDQASIRATLAESESELARVEADLAKAIERVPDEADEAAFLAEVVGLFDESGVGLGDYRTADPQRHESHHELDVTIGGTCEYAGLCRALAGLRDSPKAGRVVALDVGHAESSEPGEGVLEFSLTWRLYSRPTSVAQGEDRLDDQR